MTAASADNPNLTAALSLAAAGLTVFPAGSDKRPLLVGWQERASTEEEQVRKWWDSYPAALPAIVVGRASLVAIDCDRHPGGNDGIKAFNELVSANGAKLANVPMTKTARGGAHLFFRQPPGEPLGNGRGELPDGIDVRGIGGFVIAPGAVLPDGKRWQAVNGRPLLADAFKAGSIPELPQWLADIIRPNRRSNGGPLDEDAHGFADMPGANSRSRGEAYAAAALDGAVAELSGAPNGKRNETLNAVAFRLGRMIARGWVDEKTVADALLGASDANRYLREHGHRATTKTIESGIEAGRKQPHPDLPDRGPSSAGDGIADSNLSDLSDLSAAKQRNADSDLSGLSDLSAIRGAQHRTSGEQQQARGRKVETGGRRP
jgi:Bifunctional DNA primase/polymerase, N-terminal